MSATIIPFKKRQKEDCVFQPNTSWASSYWSASYQSSEDKEGDVKFTLNTEKVIQSLMNNLN